MKTYYVSMIKEVVSQKGLKALEKTLGEDGFIQIKSKIKVGVTHFDQRYYVSATEPGSFIAITELVFHLQIEAVRLKSDAESWLEGYLDRSQVTFEAAESSL